MGNMSRAAILMLSLSALAAAGAEVRPSSSDELGKFIREDLARWRKVVREAGIKVE